MISTDTLHVIHPCAAGCSPICCQATTACLACQSRKSGSLKFMTQLLSASIALAPVSDQRVPGHFSRSPYRLQPLSTTPDPICMPWSRNWS